MPHTVTRHKPNVVPVRLSDRQLTALDGFADDISESRSAALRLVIRAGLNALGVQA